MVYKQSRCQVVALRPISSILTNLAANFVIFNNIQSLSFMSQLELSFKDLIPRYKSSSHISFMFLPFVVVFKDFIARIFHNEM